MAGRGVRNATFSEMGTPLAHASAVLQIAQGAEMILKARIAQEHPLLVFDTIPDQTSDGPRLLSIDQLVERGWSVSYAKLPQVLWSATGLEVPDRVAYEEFGRLRNGVQHLGVVRGEIADESLTFAFRVIEPLISEWWGKTLLDYVADVGGEHHLYTQDRLEELGLPFERTSDYASWRLSQSSRART